jgi:hypothetical protein
VVYSLFSYHQKNLGDPGSSRGMFERIRVGLTVQRQRAGSAHKSAKEECTLNVAFIRGGHIVL